MNVYNVLISKHFDPASDDIESFTIVSLLHDLCKAGFYKTELRNRKNDRGEWEKVPVYTVDDQFPTVTARKRVSDRALHAPAYRGGHGHPVAHGRL